LPAGANTLRLSRTTARLAFQSCSASGGCKNSSYQR
jgi:hypothetical protein